MKHLGEETSSVGAAREAKNVDVVAWDEMPHDELVSRKQVVLEGGPNRLIDGGYDFRSEGWPELLGLGLAPNVCADSR